MPHAGQELEGPNGYRLRFVRTDADVLEMEASYAGRGDLPPAHLHPTQDERFEVLEGAVRAIVAGEERRYEAGETFAVPAGTPHQMAGAGPARLRWEVRPPLRTAEMFERLYGDGPGSLKAGTSPQALLEEFAPEFRLTAP